MIDSDSAPDLVLDLTTAGEHRFTKQVPHIYDHDHDKQDSHDDQDDEDDHDEQDSHDDQAGRGG